MGKQGTSTSFTPNLDRLAKEGACFSCACSPSSYTWAVFAALFSSTHAASAADSRGVLAAEHPTMAELLLKNGYRTAGFSSNPFLSHSFGYDRGFELLEDGLTVAGHGMPVGLSPWLAKVQRLFMPQPYLSASVINRQARRWLAQRKQTNQPFFLWLHYMDVHGPYQSKQGLTYYNKYRAERLWHKAVSAPKAITPAEHRELVRTYQEEISYMDRYVGEFLDWLRRQDLYDETLLVLCADHGDEFGEHGRYSHWRQLYEELIRVPLIIRHPRTQGGLQVQTPVSLLDVLPTVVDALELETDEAAFSGQSLWPLIQGGEESGLAGVVIGDAAPDREDSIVYVRTKDWKLIFDSTKGGYELYDLVSDAAETQNLVDRFPDQVEELEQLLWAGLDPNQCPVETSAGLELNPEVMSRLQALGYVDWIETNCNGIGKF